MQLKEDQWYQLPSGQWVQAVEVNDREGPLLQGYTIDDAPNSGYKHIFDLDVYPDDTLRSVTGMLLPERWTLDDLREATPDEAEAHTHGRLGRPFGG